jgi:dTDP-4-dehydrorhamnose 3,5-epimerase
MVDLRQGSPTFLRWHSEVLSEDNLKMVYVPEGFAHGYQALEDDSAVTYQASTFYSPSHERGICYNDPLLGIEWQVPNDAVIVSAKDQAWPRLTSGFTGVAPSRSLRRLKKKKKRTRLVDVFRKLRAADVDLARGLPLDQTCQKLGISETTYQHWRDRYVAVLTESDERLQKLEAENAHLKERVEEMLLLVLNEKALQGTTIGQSRSAQA